MRLQLTPNLETPSDAIAAIDVEIDRPDPATLTLRYIVTGAIDRLMLPSRAPPERTDGLWRHTCFEAFLRPEASDAYAELNFAPSAQWAAYAFTGYRDGMTPAQVHPPRIDAAQTAAKLELAVQLNLAGLNLPDGSCWLALSAVIEETTRAKSYWALAHPPGRPDFHHRSSFACRLPAWEAP